MNLNLTRLAVTSGLETACIRCKKKPKAVGQFCGQWCMNKAYEQAPSLIELPKNDPKWTERAYSFTGCVFHPSAEDTAVAKQFNEAWRHPITADKPMPKLIHIYKVIQTRQLFETYRDYQWVGRFRCGRRMANHTVQTAGRVYRELQGTTAERW